MSLSGENENSDIKTGWESFIQESSHDSLTASCFLGVCVAFCLWLCVLCGLFCVCEICASWVLSPAPQPCDLWVQMRCPIDHKIGVPFRLWQLNCRWRLTSHYVPCLLSFFFRSPPLCLPSLLAISASVNESNTSGTNLCRLPLTSTGWWDLHVSAE